jgi:predicted transcriptional regulator
VTGNTQEYLNGREYDERSAHWMMRQAIEQYVDREERRVKFRQDALDAWEAGYWADGHPG